MRTVVLAVLLALLAARAGAVDRSNFKTCAQSGFCRRSVRLGDVAPEARDPARLYSVVEGTARLASPGRFTAELRSPHSPATLTLEVELYEDRQLHVRVNEKAPRSPRYEVRDIIVGRPALAADARLATVAGNSVVSAGTMRLFIQHAPLHIDVFDGSTLVLVFNRNQLLEVEHLRSRDEEVLQAQQEQQRQAQLHDDDAGEGDAAADADQPALKVPDPAPNLGLWEESFKAHTDRKPKGPESVSLDLTFVNAEHVYGIPEHAAPLNLPDTRGPNAKFTDPYRLYNLDVFEYELNNPMALYGSIPFMLAHRAGASLGVLWLNAAETWVDVMRHQGPQGTRDTSTHWLSESGIIDVYAFAGASPKDVVRKYTALTGTTAMPRLFALAYHQSRWNYNDEKDVAGVDEGFEAHDIPYDVLWLDIEHTDSKKYFTWDPVKFPNPVEMQAGLAKRARKMVTIVDPHIKRVSGYNIHSEALAKDLYVKDDNNSPFDGWCWPGSSSWVDFTNADARKWWAEKFRLDQYTGSTPNLFTWNDMNEPSVFNGPEVTMHKHNLHHNGWEHRDVHNVYGFYQFMATSEALTLRDDKRPFVLSRAFFAGSQRHGAIWTGDNTAAFEHLRASVPMLLSIGVAGLAFVGADVGGFFGNPSTELLTRWYETAAFQPFFRGHAHLDTRRREPWVFGEPTTGHIRAAIRRRYALLPYWYTLFREAATAGTPAMRPLFFEFPDEPATFATDDAFMAGPALLVHPVAEAGRTQQNVFLPGGAGQRWYAYDGYAQYAGSATIQVDAPLGTMPVFLRGGSIVPRRDRVRRSSSLMAHDPFTLIVALDAQGEARGRLYVDDAESFAFRSGACADKALVYRQSALSSSDFAPVPAEQHAAHARFAAAYKPTVERIVVVGLARPPTLVEAVVGNARRSLAFTVDPATAAVTIKQPGVPAAGDWRVEFTA